MIDFPNLLSVMATQAISNVVKSSFGPSGLDKMMVDDIGVRMPTTVAFLWPQHLAGGYP